jgi:hypothetical protein
MPRLNRKEKPFRRIKNRPGKPFRYSRSRGNVGFGGGGVLRQVMVMVPDTIIQNIHQAAKIHAVIFPLEKRKVFGLAYVLIPFVFYVIPQISPKSRRMGIAKIIADVVVNNPHTICEKHGTGIKAAFVQPENDLPDGKGGTGIFMTAEYK